MFQVYNIKKEEYFSASKNEETIAEDSEDTYKAPQTLIDQLFHLLSIGKFSERMIKAQIETMFIAGSETLSLTLSYSILMLAMHSNIQEKVYQELHSVFTNQNEDVSYEHVQQLHLLDRVIKESMRLFPAGALTARYVRADTPVSNCTIPKNAIVTLSAFTMHRVSVNLNVKQKKRTFSMAFSDRMISSGISIFIR